MATYDNYNWNDFIKAIDSTSWMAFSQESDIITVINNDPSTESMQVAKKTKTRYRKNYIIS